MGAAQILHSFFFHAWICAARRSALRAAASEGLTLVRASDNATGFRGVKHGERRSKPFQALVWRNGKMQHLGRYATAEEAALTANEAEVRAARRPTDPAALATHAAAREQNERRTAQLREQARKGRK